MTELITPLFILDKDEFEKGITLFKDALNQYFKTSIMGYSVKTNSLPYCLCLARDMGCYAEVVSHDEYNLALLCGYSKNHIIYNGPMKSKETFLDAITNGAIVNIETKRELDWLKDLPQEKTYNIGIRVNVNISNISPQDAKDDDNFSRFGFCAETNELANALSEISILKHIKLSGIHVHRTSKTRSCSFYENLLDYTCKIIHNYKIDVDYIDIGGGYYGIFPNAPSFTDYSKTFYRVLSKYNLSDRIIIVEPGNALTASAFSYLTTIIDTKNLPCHRIITTDGTRNDIDPLFQKNNYIKQIIYRGSHNRNRIAKQVIAGATCLEFDKLFSVTDEYELNVGDKILYNNVGAYTMCLTPLFINYLPRVYLKDNNKFTLIREKWTAKDYITKSKIYE